MSDREMAEQVLDSMAIERELSRFEVIEGGRTDPAPQPDKGNRGDEWVH